MKEGKVDRYFDKLNVHPKRNTDADEKPPTKTIQIDGIFANPSTWGPSTTPRRGRSSRLY